MKSEREIRERIATLEKEATAIQEESQALLKISAAIPQAMGYRIGETAARTRETILALRWVLEEEL